jgi:hypothetical protein
MADRKDIKKAKDKIDSIIDLGQKIQEATPYLINIRANLDWYEETCDAINNKEEEILNPLTGPLKQIINIDYTGINVPLCSGIAATFMSASAADTREIIVASNPDKQYLLVQYDKIYEINNLIREILEILTQIDPKFCDQFKEMTSSYAQWKTDMRTNSDLAKDTRTFQEQFEGTLNKLRISKKNWNKNDFPKMSWNKMVEAISKKGSENRQAFMKQKKISEDIWKELTLIMKKTKGVNKETMDSLFKRYIEHVYAVLNLIDVNILDQ